jgi:hypothetical protein
MALCSPRACGCAISSSSLQVLGSGVAGDPFLIEGAAPVLETNAARLARTGGNLWDGLLVKTSDTNELWLRTSSTWVRISQRLTINSVEMGLNAGSRQIIGASSVLVTNGSGDGTVAYGVTFLQTPIVLGMGGDANVPMRPDLIGTPGLTSFSFRAFNQAGGLYPNSTVRINWLAIGVIA